MTATQYGRLMLGVVVACCFNHAMAASLDYLADATNAVYSLNPNSTPEEVAAAYGKGCAALTRLQNDSSFKEALSAKLKTKHPKDADEFKAARDLAQSFQDTEAGALEQMGVRKDVATRVLETSKEFAYNLNVERRPDFHTLQTQIEHTKHAVCQASEDASKAAKEKSSSLTHHFILLGIGGLAIVGADVFMTVPSAAFSNASIALGATMIGGAISKGF